MKPTSVVGGGMPTTNNVNPKWMGWFGEMGGPKQKGVKQYTVSPFRQAPLRGAFKGWAVNGTRRLAQQSVYFVPPMAIAWFTLSWAIDNNKLRNEKRGHIQGLYA